MTLAFATRPAARNTNRKPKKESKKPRSRNQERFRRQQRSISLPGHERPGHEREGRGGTIEECYLATWTRTCQTHSSTQPPSHAANQPPSYPAKQPVAILLQASRGATPSLRAVRHGEPHWVAARLRTLVGIVAASVRPLWRLAFTAHAVYVHVVLSGRRRRLLGNDAHCPSIGGVEARDGCRSIYR